MTLELIQNRSDGKKVQSVDFDSPVSFFANYQLTNRGSDDPLTGGVMSRSFCNKNGTLIVTQFVRIVARKILDTQIYGMHGDGEVSKNDTS